MSNLRQAAQQALEALIAAYQGKDKTGQVTEAIAAMRAALAEPDSDYERGFVDGMNLQTKGSVDKAVNRMAEQTTQQQEPVVWMYINRSTHETSFQKQMRSFVDHSQWKEVPLYSEPLANQEKTSGSPKPAKPEALRLADAMEYDLDWCDEAAAELRRMHGLLGKANALCRIRAEEIERLKAQPEQKPVACKTLCELCVKRGYIKCANAAKTTPIPSPQPAQQQEPVAWMVYTDGGASAYVTDNPNDLVGAYRALPLYTASTPRKPLTDEQCDSILLALDEWAKRFDHYDYGLPLYNEELRVKAREVMRIAHGIGEQA